MINYLFENNEEYREDQQSYVVPAETIQEAIYKLVDYLVDNMDGIREEILEDLNTNFSITPVNTEEVIEF